LSGGTGDTARPEDVRTGGTGGAGSDGTDCAGDAGGTGGFDFTGGAGGAMSAVHTSMLIASSSDSDIVISSQS